MEKVFIKDKQGNKVLPITHVSAVKDDNGNDIGSVMGAFEDEVRGLVDTPHENFVTVAATSSTTAATDVLPNSGQSADTIYRVSNWDGSANSGAGAYDVTKYSEYAWDDVSDPNKYIFLCTKSAIGEVFDITAYNNNTKYTDLAAALGTNGANIPDALRKGGMSVKFVQSSDNKYVQYRLMLSEFTAAQFTNTANWQGVDDEPTAISDNLVKSSGVYNKTFQLDNVAYTERYQNHYITYTGRENEDSRAYSYLYVFTVTANKIYTLSANLRKFSTNLLAVALFDSNDVLIKIISYLPETDRALFKGIIDTTGLSNAAKLKVFSVKDDSYKPILNEVVPKYDQISKFGRFLEYDSMEDNKSISSSDGSIVTLNNDRIYTYSLTNRDKVIFIDTNAPGHTNLYSFVAIYNNGSLVKIVKTCNGSNYNSRLIVNVGDYECDTLKVVAVYNAGVPVVFAPFEYIIKFSDISGQLGLNQIDNKVILSTNGSYTLLSPTEEVYKGAIQFADGEIFANLAPRCTVQKYTLTPNTIIKLHFFIANLNYVFAGGCLRKNGNAILIFERLYSTVAAKDYVIDNSLLQADELWLTVDTPSKGDTIVSASATVLDTPSVAPTPLTPITDVLTMPTDIHLLTHNPDKFGVIQRLYIEGLAKGEQSVAKTITLEGRQNIIVEESHSRTQEENYVLPIHITANGCTDQIVNANIVKTSVNRLKNNTVKLMCIGDSLTAGGYPSVVNFIGKCLNQDYCSENESIEFVPLGVRPFSPTLSLGNYSFQTRSYYEGLAGRAACDHLRHFFTVLLTKTHWDLLGLGTMTRNGVPGRAYVAFDETNQDHLDLMCQTCHGWYDVENTAEVFNDLKTTFGITSFEYDGQSYTLGSTYSSDQYPAMVAAFKYILNWGACAFSYLSKVDFYDYDTVQQSNGDHSFNFGAYLNRFKTLANDGKTRLVAGETAGSLVWNVDNWDVCTPSHVMLIMGVNIMGRYNQSAQATVDVIEQIADLIHSYDASIKIGIGCARKYGAFNPYTYESFPGFFRYDSYRLSVWEEEKTRFASSNYALLPTYALQTVFGTSGGYGFDSCDLYLRQKMEGDYTHAGTPMGYLAWAYEVVAWVASTYVS